MNRNITFIATFGVERAPHNEYIPWALEQAGWKVTVVAPNEASSLVRRMFGCRWSWRDLQFGGRTGRVRSELNLLREAVRARFGRSSVIIASSQGLGWRGAALFLGPKLGKRLVYHSSDYYDPITHPVRAWLEGRLMRKCDLFVTNEFHRGYVYRAQHGLRCPVLISPANLPAAWPVPPRSEGVRREAEGGVASGAFVLRLNSTFSPLRMAPQVFEALSLLPSRFRLVMSGEGRGWHPEAEALAHKLGIYGRILMLPPLDYADMLAYTSNADAGVLLYNNNDLGNYFQGPGRLTEYLACGLPVLASRFAGLEGLVYRYGIGECCDAGNPKAIAAGIVKLESGIASGVFARERIRRCFEQYFAYEQWAPRVVAAFENLLSKAPKAQQAPPPEYWFPAPPSDC
jgi:hypothetical protein